MMYDGFGEENSAYYYARRRKEIMEFYNKLKRLNYYELLGVKVSASGAEITAAYEHLAGSFMKDVMNENYFADMITQLMMILDELRKAEQILSHQLSREAYDQMIIRKHLPHTVKRKICRHPNSRSGSTFREQHNVPAVRSRYLPIDDFKRKLLYLCIGFVLFICVIAVFKREPAPPPAPPFLKMK